MVTVPQRYSALFFYQLEVVSYPEPELYHEKQPRKWMDMLNVVLVPSRALTLAGEALPSRKLLVFGDTAPLAEEQGSAACGIVELRPPCLIQSPSSSPLRCLRGRGALLPR